MTVLNKSRTVLEENKFRAVGSGADKVGTAVLIYGQDSNNLNLPILVVNDGSDRGKIVTNSG